MGFMHRCSHKIKFHPPNVWKGPNKLKFPPFPAPILGISVFRYEHLENHVMMIHLERSKAAFRYCNVVSDSFLYNLFAFSLYFPVEVWFIYSEMR